MGDKTMTNKGAIVAKIEKLLALAGNNNNENERNAAMERAYKMLADHNITMNDVRRTATKTTIDIEQLHTDISTRDENKTLIAAVCKLYYTSWYMSDGKLTIYGTPENIQSTLSIAKWLLASIDKQAKREYGGQGRIAIGSFRRGAAMGVYVQANALVKAEQEQHTSHIDKMRAHVDVEKRAEVGTQLMVIRNTLVKANEDYAKNKLRLRYVRSTSRRQTDHGAYNSGKSYGSSLNLGRQIGGSTTKQISG